MATQLLANALISSSIILAVAVGFAIIFETARFFHFAHGAVLTLGAYATLAFTNHAGIRLVPAFLLSVICSALMGLAFELVIYRPIRKKHGSPLVLLLASLGLYILLENAFGLVFGNATRTIRGDALARSFELLGARLTSIQLTIIVVGFGLVVLTHLLMSKTRAGKAMRAVADDPELALISGINTDRVLLWAFGLGSALAGAAGTLMAMDADLRPTMGMQPLMLAVVAVIVGGRGSTPGIALGALLIGVSQQIGGLWMGTEWQDTVVFLLLLGFLVARPRGFLGRELRQTKG